MPAQLNSHLHSFADRLRLPLVPTLLLCAALPIPLGAACDPGDDGDHDRSPIDWCAIGDDAVVVSRITYVTDPSRPTESYPTIFNDPDVSGIQGTIHLDVYPTIPHAHLLITEELDPTLITTSFSSKSEGSLHRSADGRYLTYMGYAGAPGLEGVSNSYDLGAGTNLIPPVLPAYDRAVARVAFDGALDVTQEANAFSGDNPRSALTVDGSQFYMVGNSDSTIYTGPPKSGPGLTIGVRYGQTGSEDSTQLATYTAINRSDESAKQHIKDNNWRGLTLFGDTIYISKGSGGNGNNGVFELLVSGGGLPTPSTTNSIVPLFDIAATDPLTGIAETTLFPFGIWFADADNLYVCDEGNETLTAAGALSPDANAGLQKWHRNGAGTWQMVYTIQAGLDLLEPKTVSGYPVPTETYGLRNLTAFHRGDGTVVVFAITAQSSTISTGEPDPTRLVMVTDRIADTTLASHGGLDHFQVLQEAKSGEVFRGVSLLPRRDHPRW